MELKISEKFMKKCFENALEQIEHETGFTLSEAVEKQIPMAPIERHYEEPGEKPYIKVCCPKGCKRQLHKAMKYCDECGQRIDWSEYE